MKAPPVPQATKGRYGAGMAWQVLGRLVHAGAALLTLSLITRELGLQAVGVYAAYFHLLMLLEVVVDGGSALALLRRSSEAPGLFRTILRQAYRLRTLLAVAGIAVFAGYAAYEDAAGLRNPWLWCAALSLLSLAPGAAAVVFNLRMEFALVSLVRAAGAAIGCAGVAALLASGATDPLLLLASTQGGRVVVQLGSWAAARRHLHAYPPAADPRPGAYLRESLTLGGGNLLRDGYARIDVLLLKSLLGDEAAGLYAPAKAALQVSLMLPSYLLTVALPRLAADAERRRAAFFRQLRRLALGLGAFAFPAALLSLPLVPHFLVLFFGSQVEPATPSLRILAFAAALAYVGSVFVTGLIADGRARETLELSAVGLALNLGGCLLLIPAWSLEGAAAARVAAEAVTLALAALRLRAAQRSRPAGSGSPRPRSSVD